MPGLDRKRKMVGLSLFLAPIVIVKLAGAYLSQPSQAAASTNVQVEAVSTTTTKAVKGPAWNTQSRRTAHRARVLATQPFAESPLYYGAPPEQVAEIPTQTTPDGPQLSPVPDVIVSLIMKSNTGQVALIDNKKYRVGDALGETGWIITAIDSDARSVTLHDPKTFRNEIKKVKTLETDR